MKNKYIEIIHSNRDEVLSAVQGFANLYSSNEFSKTLNVFGLGSEKYVVELVNIDAEYIKYAVNYFRYPENKAAFRFVLGHDPIGKMNYYVPESDEEYDNCYSIDSSGESIKHSFCGTSSRTETSQQYIGPDIVLRNSDLICTISGVRHEKKGLFTWLFG